MSDGVYWPVASGLDEASVTTAAHRDDGETMPQRGTARSIFDAEPHSFNRSVHILQGEVTT
jgi:hypothetical protein